MKIVINISNHDYKYELDRYGKDVVSFGSGKECDIVIGYYGISKVQGCFYKENGKWYIKNLGGVNNVYYNNRKIDTHVIDSGLFSIPVANGGFIVIRPFEAAKDNSGSAQGGRKTADNKTFIQKNYKKISLIAGIVLCLGVVSIILASVLSSKDESGGGRRASDNGSGLFNLTEAVSNTTEAESTTENHVLSDFYDQIDGVDFFQEVSIGNDKKTNTVMIYMVGSDLESYAGAASADIEEILSSGYDKSKTNVLILTGGSVYWHSEIPGSVNSIIRITEDNTFVIEGSTEYAENMGEPSTLVGFLNYCYENYKAEHYSLIFWDHGGGPVFGFGSDELYNDRLDFNELKNALGNSPFKGSNKLDFIGFDACLMGSIEYANMLQPFTDYVVASSEVEPSYGWDYRFLKVLDRTSDAKEIGKSIVDEYFSFYEADNNGYDQTMACYDLSYVDELVSDLNAFYDSLRSNMGENYYLIAGARNNSYSYGSISCGSREEAYDLVDLVSFIEELKNSYSAEAGKALEDINKMMCYSKSGTSFKNGLSIYFPYDNKYLFYQLGESVISDISISSNYTAFVRDFFNNRTSNVASNNKVYKNVFKKEGNVFDPDNGIQIKLDDEQKKNLAKVTATFLYRDYDVAEDKYIPVLINHEVQSDDNGVIFIPYDQKIYIISNEYESMVVPFEEMSSNENERRLVSRQLAYNNEGGISANSDMQLIDISITDSDEGIVVLSITESDSEYGKAEFIPEEWYDYLICGNRCRPPLYDINGELLPFEQWEAGTLAISCVNLDSDYKIEKMKIKDLQYDIFCMITIEDIYGDKYTLDIQKITGNNARGEYKNDDGAFFYTENDEGIIIEKYSGTKESISIPETINNKAVTQIGEFAFSRNDTIKSINIPEGIEYVGINAFYNCSSLETVVLPEGVKYIGSGAFMGCDSIKSISIPESCEFLGDNCFSYCPSLERLIIPSKVKYIGDSIVSNTLVEIDDNNEHYCILNNAIYSKDKKELVYYFGKDKSYTIPDATEIIKHGAFKYNDYLESVIIPDSVKKIGNQAFLGVKLNNVNIPEDIAFIGSYAFGGPFDKANINLEELHLGKNIKHIGKYALETVVIHKFTVDESNEYFANVNGCLTNKNRETLLMIPDSIEGEWSIPDGIVSVAPLKEYGNISAIEVNDDVLYLDGSCFKNVEKIVIGKGLKNWKEMQYMFKLKDVSISDDNETYKYSEGAIFSKDGTSLLYYLNCNTEAEYRIPDGVISVEINAFSNSNNIKKLIIPPSVIEMGDKNKSRMMRIFNTRHGLEYIEVEAGNASFMSDNGVLYSADGKRLLAVPPCMSGIINIHEGTEIVDCYAVAFDSNYSDEEGKYIEIHIPDGVSTILVGNFDKNFSGDFVVYLPESLNQVSNSAFENNDFYSGGYTIYGEPGGIAEKIAKKNSIEFIEK